MESDLCSSCFLKLTEFVGEPLHKPGELETIVVEGRIGCGRNRLRGRYPIRTRQIFVSFFQPIHVAVFDVELMTRPIAVRGSDAPDTRGILALPSHYSLGTMSTLSRD